MNRHAQSRRTERWNRWLSFLLLAAIGIEANLVVRRTLFVRLDLSEDQLYTTSPALKRLLGKLDDKLAVKAYFTKDIRSGELALARARLNALLAEYGDLARGRLRLDTIDPESSSANLLEAEGYGLLPYEVRSMQGIVEVRQSVYLGLVLRYRGREQSLPFVSPSTLESSFSQALDNLLREQTHTVGWIAPASGADPAAARFGAFIRARELIARRHNVRSVEGLELAQPVGQEVDLLVLLRPENLHPRAAFEVDQFVQRGGRLIVCIDQRPVDLSGLQVRPVERTGLEPLLRTWGANVTPQHIWDDQNAPVLVRRKLKVGNEYTVQSVPVQYPLYLRLTGSSYATDLPPVAGLQDGLLPWAQPIEPGPLPEGVERLALIESSSNAYRVPLLDSIDFSEEHLQGQSKANYALGSGQRYLLACVLRGRLPSAFAEAGAPAAWDPLGASSAGRTDEVVLSGASESQVVVVGDCDFMRDDYLPVNKHLVANLVDWMVLDEDLLALRSRSARERPLRDFYAEELRERELDGLPSGESLAVLDERMRAESAARTAARRKQWMAMLVPTGVSLLSILGLAFAWQRWQYGAWTRRRA